MKKGKHILHLPWRSLHVKKLHTPLIEAIKNDILICLDTRRTSPKIMIGTDSQKTHAGRYKYAPTIIVDNGKNFRKVYYTTCVQSFYSKDFLKKNDKRLLNERKISTVLVNELFTSLAKDFLPFPQVELHADYSKNPEHLSNRVFLLVQDQIALLENDHLKIVFKPGSFAATKGSDHAVRASL